MAERNSRKRKAPSAVSAEVSTSAAFREALRHARPFIKSDLEWHSGNIQEHPTFMTEFLWTPGMFTPTVTESGHEYLRCVVPPEPIDPLIHVRFPHLALSDTPSCYCVDTSWQLTSAGCKFVRANMSGDHLTLDEYKPLISTCEIARAAHKMTVSWVMYDDREDFEAEAVVTNPTDASHWDLANCFPDNWPNVRGLPKVRDENTADEEQCNDGWRPGDLVIFRLFVDEQGLEGGPAELREVVRRVVEKGEEIACSRQSDNVN